MTQQQKMVTRSMPETQSNNQQPNNQKPKLNPYLHFCSMRSTDRHGRAERVWRLPSGQRTVSCGDGVGWSESEMQSLVVHRHVAAARRTLSRRASFGVPVGRHDAAGHDRADRIAIAAGRAAHQIDHEPMPTGTGRVVAQQDGAIVEVGDEQIQIAVVVHVAGATPRLTAWRQLGDARLLRDFGEQPCPSLTNTWLGHPTSFRASPLDRKMSRSVSRSRSTTAAPQDTYRLLGIAMPACRDWSSNNPSPWLMYRHLSVKSGTNRSNLPSPFTSATSAPIDPRASPSVPYATLASSAVSSNCAVPLGCRTGDFPTASLATYRSSRPSVVVVDRPPHPWSARDTCRNPPAASRLRIDRCPCCETAD